MVAKVLIRRGSKLIPHICFVSQGRLNAGRNCVAFVSVAFHGQAFEWNALNKSFFAINAQDPIEQKSIHSIFGLEVLQRTKFVGMSVIGTLAVDAEFIELPYVMFT